jgi:phospho-N-acetylmuramoyl-pentapeptide-transferase
MIAWLVPWLEDLWQPFHALQYITVRAALASATGFATALLLGGPLIRRLQKVGVGEHAGLSDSADVAAAYRAAGKSGTPTMGGVFWVASVLLGTLLFARPDELLVLLGSVLLVGMGAIGFLDDWMKFRRVGGRDGLSRAAKFIPSLLLCGYVAAMLWMLAEKTGRPEVARIYFPVLKEFFASPESYGIWGLGLFVVFETFVILACSHAANVTDGMDGLAAGSAMPAFIALTIAVYAVGHIELAAYLHLPFLPGAGEVAVMGGAVLGSTLGFLWFNTYPAKVFLGDSGSLPMGALLAYFAIISKQELALPLLAAVFVIEIGSSLLQILWFKLSRRIYGSPRRLFRIAPIHHVFQLKGMPEPQIVVRFWIFGAVAAALGLLLLKVR